MSDLTNRVDALFADYDKPDSPGCALAIVRDGAVIYQRGYGRANLDHDIPITPDTVFHVASVSKQFTTMAILLLEAEGKLSIDDDIREYVPEIPDYGATITIRHLMNHTSGLRDQWDILSIAGWDYEDDLISNRHVLNIASRQKQLNFAPGEEYVYCNTGYTLLAIITERISGQSFRDFTHDHIFEPLGMMQTHFHDDHTMIVKKRAMAYAPTGEGGFKISIPTFDTVGATSLFTTVLDLAKWEQNYYHYKVGGAAVAEKILQRGVLNNGKEIPYAAGVNTAAYKGLATIGHSGADAGYRSHFVTFPDYNFGVIVLCNLGTISPNVLARSVADIYLADYIDIAAEPDPIELSADERAQYVGLYYNETTKHTFQITEQDEALTLDGTLPLTTHEGNYLKLARYSMEMVCTRDADNHIETLNFRSIGSDDENVYRRVEVAAITPDDFATYQGIYYSDELLTHYEIVLEDYTLILRHIRNEDVTLKPTLVDSFKLHSPDMQFDRDTNGDIVGFTLYTPRVRGIQFYRVESASLLI